MGPPVHVALCLCRRSSHRNQSPEYERKPDPHLVWTADDLLRAGIRLGVLEKNSAGRRLPSYSFLDATLRRQWLADAVRLPAGQFSHSVPPVSASVHAIIHLLDKAK